MQQLAGPIFEDKVIDFILEIAKVTPVVIDKATLYQTHESDAAPAKKVAKKSSKKGASKQSSAKRTVAKKLGSKKPEGKNKP